jgi:hypothetical protein
MDALACSIWNIAVFDVRYWTKADMRAMVHSIVPAEFAES